MNDYVAELSIFRRSVTRFLDEHVAPHYQEWERDGIIPAALYRAMGEHGFLCVDVPETYGGAGATFPFSTAVVEETARLGYLALATNLTVHSGIVAMYILHVGSEAQKRNYLPRMVAGECVGAIAMTEPAAGSDLQGIRMSATDDGGHYIINGAKTFITNGQNAGVVITAAKTDPASGAKGMTLFCVDADLPGFRRGRKLDKIGQQSADTSELFFDHVRVPASAVLGRVGSGFGHLMDELPRERLLLATVAVAHAEGALQQAVEYTTTRTAFGQLLAVFQNTRFEIARMKTEIEVHRAFVEKCAGLYATGTLDTATASMAKLACTEMECRVTDGCLQLFGGYGYMTEYSVSRYWADARVQRIYGGTSEIMKELIARSLVGR